MSYENNKFPRIAHTTFSPSALANTTRDDKINDIWWDHLKGKELIIQRKIDGTNFCFDSKHVFARTHSKVPRGDEYDYAKAIHSRFRHLIPNQTAIFGEYLYLIHTIEYTQLPAYFFSFRIKVGDYWLSWEATVDTTQRLKLPTVPILEIFTPSSARELQDRMNDLHQKNCSIGGTNEGLVVWNSKGFHTKKFSENVFKYVRADFVPTGTPRYDERPKVGKLYNWNSLAKQQCNMI